jgi:hypothetical protein
MPAMSLLLLLLLLLALALLQKLRCRPARLQFTAPDAKVAERLEPP